MIVLTRASFDSVVRRWRDAVVGVVGAYIISATIRIFHQKPLRQLDWFIV
jgi:hypothetical protein